MEWNGILVEMTSIREMCDKCVQDDDRFTVPPNM